MWNGRRPFAERWSTARPVAFALSLVISRLAFAVAGRLTRLQ